MASTGPESAWDWRIFAAVVLVLLIASIGQGAFLQIEESLLLPNGARGQTIAAECGWPFVVLVTTEAYTLDVAWAERKFPIALYVVADLLIVGVVACASTRQFSRWHQFLRGESRVAATLAAVAAFAFLLREEVDWHWYNDGVGAFTAALFRCTEAVVLLLVVLTWYYFITRLGGRFARLFNRQVQAT